MSRRPTTVGGRRSSRRSITYLWIAGLTLVVVLLLYWEQTALLYVLATLGVTALLVVVAVADLSGPEKAAASVGPADEAAALSSGPGQSSRVTGATDWSSIKRK